MQVYEYIWLTDPNHILQLALNRNKVICCPPSLIVFILVLILTVNEHGRKVLFCEDPIETPSGLVFMIVVGDYHPATYVSGHISVLLISFLKTAILKHILHLLILNIKNSTANYWLDMKN